MTTQTTTIRPSRNGARALIGAAAATLAVLGGALLWQARPTSETAAPTTTTVRTMNEGVAPLGRLAERDPATFSDQEMYSRWLQAAPAAAARSGQDVSDREMFDAVTARRLQAEQAEVVRGMPAPSLLPTLQGD